MVDLAHLIDSRAIPRTPIFIVISPLRHPAPAGDSLRRLTPMSARKRQEALREAMRAPPLFVAFNRGAVRGPSQIARPELGGFSNSSSSSRPAAWPITEPRCATTSSIWLCEEQGDGAVRRAFQAQGATRSGGSMQGMDADRGSGSMGDEIPLRCATDAPGSAATLDLYSGHAGRNLRESPAPTRIAPLYACRSRAASSSPHGDGNRPLNGLADRIADIRTARVRHPHVTAGRLLSPFTPDVRCPLLRDRGHHPRVPHEGRGASGLEQRDVAPHPRSERGPSRPRLMSRGQARPDPTSFRRGALLKKGPPPPRKKRPMRPGQSLRRGG